MSAAFILWTFAAQLPGSLELGNLGSQGLTVLGASSIDKTGVTVRGGFDLNGDGLTDLAVGSSLASPLGRLQAGQVTVVFGTANPPPSIDLANPPVATLTIQGAAPDDRTGIWLASGFDWNGDGLDDLAIGAWLADPLGRADAGVVSIVMGMTQPPPFLDLAAPPLGAVVQILGARAGDGLGLAIDACGDLDGDGIDDLVLGAPFADVLGIVDAGAAYVVKGGVAALDLLSPGALACEIRGKAPANQNGRSVAGRFVNGAARYVAVGAQFADPLGRPDAGEVALVPITAPWPLTIDLSQPSPGTAFVAGPSAGSGCGITVANGGDHDLDGVDELAVGSWRAAGPVGNGAGRVDVLDIVGLPALVDLALVNSAALTLFGAQPGSMFGNIIGDGFDADADGFPDLFMGMRSFDKPGKTNCGAGVLLRRPATFAATVVNLAAPPVNVHFQVGVDTNDYAGYDLRSAGDVNGDGLPDLVVGALNATPGLTPNTGAAYVVFDVATALPPKLVSLDPGSGPLTGGTTIELHAESLSILGSTQLFLGGVPATNVHVVNSTLAHAVAPASMAPGAVDATLVNVHGSSNLTAAYIYEPRLAAQLSGSAVAGGVLTLDLLADPGNTAWALYALGSTRPLTVLPFGYGLALDFASLAFLSGPHPVVNSDGTLTINIPFGPVPVLAGVNVHVQLLVLQPSGGAFSNAVSVTL